jgi:hypothetical protein
MTYSLQHYDEEPIIEEDHDTIIDMETENLPLSRLVENVIRTYTKPVLIKWYTMGCLEYYYIKQ